MVSPETGEEVQVTFDPGGDFNPSWAPDSRRVVFNSLRGGESDIWIVDITGGPPVPLTADAADDRFPAWSPTGDRIAFQSNRSGNYEVWVVEVGGVPALPTTWGSLKRREWSLRP